MPDPFTSSRLIYRAFNGSADDTFILQLQKCHTSWWNYIYWLNQPPNLVSASQFREFLQARFLAVIICLSPTTDSGRELTPIGFVTLKKDIEPGYIHHHRNATFAICLLDEYQRKGYGSEALRWALQWGFESAGLHRIEIHCLGWNEGAKRLYKRLGFKEEGVSREAMWFDGKFWDFLQFGMLEDEWRGMRDETEDWKPGA